MTKCLKITSKLSLGNIKSLARYIQIALNIFEFLRQKYNIKYCMQVQYGHFGAKIQILSSNPDRL